MVTKAADDSDVESTVQFVSLFMWNQTSARIEGKDVLRAGRIVAIQAALSPPDSVDAVSGIMIGLFLAANPA